MKIKEVKVGDVMTRILGGHPMKVVVGVVKEDVIFCGSIEGFVPATEDAGWQFRRDTGAEVDADLGWDGIKITGSYLKIE